MKRVGNNVNVNLDHHIPAAPLLSVSEYQTIGNVEDNTPYQKKAYIDFRDFKDDAFWGILRKPEFQRPTNKWDDDDTVQLLTSLIHNFVIPGVILWFNPSTKEIFVLDGAHRLSVIRAWVMDDWGDSEDAYEYGFIEEDEYTAAQRIRKLINEEIGSFKEAEVAGSEYRKIIKKRILPDETLDKKTALLGSFMNLSIATLQIPIQWVIGDYKIAEQSFININMRGQSLDEDEKKFIVNRRAPIVRAIKGIATNASDESLWLTKKK